MDSITTAKIKQSAGFTLIELIMVVVILGVLAAFALPLFFGASSDAKRASIESVYGTIHTVAKVSHDQAQINNAGTGNFRVNYADGTAGRMYRGYPTVKNPGSNTGGIVLMAGIEEEDFRVTRYPDTTINNSVRIEPKGHDSSTNCYVEYNRASAQDIPPVITLDISGC